MLNKYMPAQGLWNIGGINLPDFGISEALGIGPKNTAIVAPNAPVFNTDYTTPSGQTRSTISDYSQGTTPQTGSFMPQYDMSGQAIAGPGLGSTYTANNWQSNVPTLSGGGGGNTASWGGQNVNTSGYPGQAQTGMTESQWGADQAYRQQQQAQQEEAARSAYNAENSRLNTQFDYNAAQAQNQLGTLGTQKDQSMAQVDLGLGDVQRQIGTSKTNLATNTQEQIKQAGSIARSTQGQNRNQLRALGILNSSAAGQILAKPMNTFDQQRGSLGQFLVQKNAELDDFVNQKVKEATSTKDSIVANYNNLVNQIQTDLRFNQRQRNDALQSANAVLNQRLAEISQAVTSYQQQAQQQKQQMLASLAQVTNFQNPTINTALYQIMGIDQPQRQQVAMTPEDRRRLGSI